MCISTRFLIRVFLTAGVVLISSVAGDGLALAQSLDDFKRADGVKGCPGIPYPELARRCMDTMVDVNESCKLVKWSCRDGNLQSIRTNTQIAQDLARDIESKENALRTEERNLASAKEADKRAIEDKIRDLKKAIGEQQEKKKAADESAVGARKEPELRLAFGTKCLELRGKVNGYFKEGIDRAKSDAGKSDVNPEIKRIIQNNLSRWEAEYGEHKQVINDVTDGIRYCQDWLQGR
jgi:hypothetical protein